MEKVNDAHYGRHPHHCGKARVGKARVGKGRVGHWRMVVRR
jgi:hypothetical protein